MRAPTWNVICGNAIDVLKSLPDNSIHVSVCSPPYFRQRSYRTEPQVWGGDHGCGHAWSEGLVANPGGGQGSTGEMATRNAWRDRDAGGRNLGNVCLRCGAWKGELGSEVTPARFVENLVAIFREARRVLRGDADVGGLPHRSS